MDLSGESFGNAMDLSNFSNYFKLYFCILGWEVHLNIETIQRNWQIKILLPSKFYNFFFAHGGSNFVQRSEDPSDNGTTDNETTKRVQPVM